MMKPYYEIADLPYLLLKGAKISIKSLSQTVRDSFPSYGFPEI